MKLANTNYYCSMTFKGSKMVSQTSTNKTDKYLHTAAMIINCSAENFKMYINVVVFMYTIVSLFTLLGEREKKKLWFGDPQSAHKLSL